MQQLQVLCPYLMEKERKSAWLGSETERSIKRGTRTRATTNEKKEEKESRKGEEENRGEARASAKAWTRTHAQKKKKKKKRASQKRGRKPTGRLSQSARGGPDLQHGQNGQQK